MRKGRLPGVVKRIENIYPQLNGALKDVADIIVNSPEFTVNANVSKIAQKSNTSDSAVVRLSQRLGYKGFRDLQINLAYDLGDTTNNLDEEIEITDTLASIAEKSYHANVNTLQQSWESLDFEAIEKAIRLINNARFVYIFAQGTNYSTGVDLSYNLTKLGVRCIVQNDSFLQVVSSAVATRDDLAIGISHTGANSEVLDSLSLARESGAATIGLTTRKNSPIVRLADVSLCTASKEIVFQGEPLTSRMSLMYIVDLLFLGVATTMGRYALPNIKKVREALKSKRDPN
ncbi:MurR/RpiR family transcriptional regulator [Bacillus sp. Marseille-P3661]|uniref:MurR/RpiR family transcriptional regulator n=1 Tax=Bacillus sp. Marseille-P3661 TaxID=1936234 RepID=UPI0015E15E96|nr:MurR/RpiR family transcriptional regulator [Bacillus sp. Marseille-P3661]